MFATQIDLLLFVCVFFLWTLSIAGYHCYLSYDVCSLEVLRSLPSHTYRVARLWRFHQHNEPRVTAIFAWHLPDARQRVFRQGFPSLYTIKRSDITGDNDDVFWAPFAYNFVPRRKSRCYSNSVRNFQGYGLKKVFMIRYLL